MGEFKYKRKKNEILMYVDVALLGWCVQFPVIQGRSLTEKMYLKSCWHLQEVSLLCEVTGRVSVTNCCVSS